MFYSLTGKLVHMEPGVVAIECGGVAFKCFTSMNTQKNMPRIGETATVYTHLNVREDALDLYGFSTKSELNCYKMLTTISGVGPKLAQRIVLELKDKVAKGFVDGINLEDVGAATAAPAAQGAGQAIAALVSLGYSQSEAALAVSKIDASLPVEEIIKLALRGMAGRR